MDTLKSHGGNYKVTAVFVKTPLGIFKPRDVFNKIPHVFNISRFGKFNFLIGVNKSPYGVNKSSFGDNKTTFGSFKASLGDFRTTVGDFKTN